MNHFVRRLGSVIRRTGYTRFLTIVTAAVLGCLYVASIFFDPLLEWLQSKHLFEVVVILVLIEVLVLGLDNSASRKDEVIMFEDETEAQDAIRRLLVDGRIVSVTIMSAGLASRRAIIGQMLRAGLTVEVIAQDPATALDRDDATRTKDSLRWIRADVRGKVELLAIWLDPNVSSLRAVILRERDGRTVHLFLGWYTYQKANAELIGSQNPTWYMNTHSEHGSRLEVWVSQELDRHRAESHRVSLDNDADLI